MSYYAHSMLLLSIQKWLEVHSIIYTKKGYLVYHH